MINAFRLEFKNERLHVVDLDAGAVTLVHNASTVASAASDDGDRVGAGVEFIVGGTIGGHPSGAADSVCESVVSTVCLAGQTGAADSGWGATGSEP